MQNTLNGWCASIRWADKLINSDSIHTAKGHPIYFECTDNYDDLRARFAPLVARLRTINQLTSIAPRPTNNCATNSATARFPITPMWKR